MWRPLHRLRAHQPAADPDSRRRARGPPPIGTCSGRKSRPGTRPVANARRLDLRGHPWGRRHGPHQAHARGAITWQPIHFRRLPGAWAARPSVSMVCAGVHPVRECSSPTLDQEHSPQGGAATRAKNEVIRGSRTMMSISVPAVRRKDMKPAFGHARAGWPPAPETGLRAPSVEDPAS